MLLLCISLHWATAVYSFLKRHAGLGEGHEDTELLRENLGHRQGERGPEDTGKRREDTGKEKMGKMERMLTFVKHFLFFFLFIIFLNFLFFFKKMFIYLHQLLVAARGIFSLCYTTQTLSCHMWDLVPRPRIESRPLCGERGVLATGPSRKSLE